MKLKDPQDTRHFSKSRRLKTQRAMSLQKQRSTLQLVAYKRQLLTLPAKVWQELLRTTSRKVWDVQAQIDSLTSISSTIILKEKLSEVKKKKRNNLLWENIPTWTESRATLAIFPRGCQTKSCISIKGLQSQGPNRGLARPETSSK